MKKIFLLVFLLFSRLLPADEGMWLPLLLKQLNEREMQQMGLKLSAADIYSVNKSSLKDAVVQFGRGCTGEVVSGEGLLFTNHHCGYGQIQAHSTVENDYLAKGFWAKSRSEELPNPGLTVTFIIRMEDVSDKILKGLDTASTETLRENIIARRSLELVRKATEGNHYEALVKPMYNGNEYYLFVTEVFRDIRLVGAPPNTIGNFGKDTDNWTWPRHTGDFSIFRIYAGKDNKPADYSPDNVPFRPRHHFPVNIAGVNENDFTMVYGFPGRTNEYLTSYAVEQVVRQSNPLKVSLREKRLQAMKPAMEADREVFLKYTGKYSSVSNYHKKWAGETAGLLKAGAIEKKQAIEKTFAERVATRPQFAVYRSLLGQLEEEYRQLEKIQPEMDLLTEGLLTVELFRLATYFKPLEELSPEALKGEKGRETVASIRKQAEEFFKGYHAPIDKKIMEEMMKVYVSVSAQPFAEGRLDDPILPVVRQQPDLPARAFDYSFLNAWKTVMDFLDRVEQNGLEALLEDPVYKLSKHYHDYYRNVVLKEYTAVQNRLIPLNRLYVKALRDVMPQKKYYPDANFSLRVAYGKVEGYTPAAGSKYNWHTTAGQILEKNNTGNPDYEMDERLKALILDKDYGRYANKDGELPTCFIASNHTTGGNSGSPVLNGKGQLIGINFDRNWEGTMSDIHYDISQVRNIIVDMRYVLFLIDKYAGAGYLLKEMSIVER